MWKQALAVIEAHDMVGHIVNGFRVIDIVLSPNPFHFEIQKEPLHYGIIPQLP